MTSHQPRGLSQLRLSRLFVCLTLLISICISGPDGRAQQPEDVIRVRTDLITVPFKVNDSHGRGVAGLRREDFTLADDGLPTQIAYFAQGEERVALAFVLDNSGSLRNQLARQREAALSLFAHFGATSTVTVLRFGPRTQTVIDFTRDADRVRAAFDSPGYLGGGTAIFDAADAAVKSLAARDPADRHIAILISDGLDTSSLWSWKEVVEAANKANVSFYVIQLPLLKASGGRLVPRAPSKGFRELAEKTGGKYFVAGNAQSALDPKAPVDLSNVFAAIEEDIRSQYVVGFYPGEASRDGRAHGVVVNLSDSKHKKFRLQQFRTAYQVPR